eukprot:1457321-Amphidinium_carterae.1
MQQTPVCRAEDSAQPILQANSSKMLFAVDMDLQTLTITPRSLNSSASSHFLKRFWIEPLFPTYLL